MKSSAGVTAVLLLLALLSGCGCDDGASTLEGNASGPRGAALGHGSAIRGCNGVHFDGPGPPDWRVDSAWIGPFGITEGSRPPDFSKPTTSRGRDGLYRTKTPTLVEGHRPVKVSIAPKDVDRAAILGVSIHDVYESVTYIPCSDRPRTTYPAGFVFRDRRPLALLVAVGDGPARRLVVGRGS
jgi:hypothetical protein